MKKVAVIALVSIAVFAFSMSPLYALTTRDVLSEKYASMKDICPVVKSSLAEGMNTRDVVKTSIQMGHAPCTVVKCSLDAGGGLEQTILGAIDGGATSDVVSRCAIDAGAGPEEIARILEREGLPGLGYTQLPPTLTPVTANVPGSGRGGGFVSPSRFR